jgi:nucleoside-diphosphate-sugar epimerase
VGSERFPRQRPRDARPGRRLGLESELCPSDAAAARRFLFRNERLHLLPSGPGSFLTCPVLSLRGRLRVLGEPFAAEHPGGDETVYEFARRRIGAEAAHVLVGAMVSGVFAGDARQLSLASCFPKMAEMEAEHGGLVKAMLAKQRARGAARRELAKLRARGGDAPEMERPGGPVGPAGRLTSFRGGIQTFTDTLAAALGPAVESGRAVESLEGIDGREGSTRLWRLNFAGGELLEADEVVLAIPAAQAAPLVAPLDEVLAATLRAIPSAGLAVVALAYDALDVPRSRARPACGGTQRLRLPRAARSLGSRAADPRRAVGFERLSRRARSGGEGSAAGDDRRGARSGGRRPARGGAAGASPGPTSRAPWGSMRRPRPSATGSSVTGWASVSTRSGTRRGWRRSRPASRRSPGLQVAGQSYFGVSMNGCCEQAARFAEECVVRFGAPAEGAGLRVLIAGCGDLGVALGLELAAGGDEVFGLRRHPDRLPAPIRPLAADLGAPETLRELPEVDAVVYAAAADRATEEAYRRAYVDGVRNLLAAPALAAVATSAIVFRLEHGRLRPGRRRVDRRELAGRGDTLPRPAAARRGASAARQRIRTTATTVLRLSGIYGPGRTRLVELVRSGRATYPPGPPRYANRIHRDDAAGALAHLLRLPAPEALYLGVDDAPVDLAEVLTFLAVELDAPLPRLEEEPNGPGASSPERTSKRCSNARLKSTGYRFRHPTYREGYGALVRQLAQEPLPQAAGFPARRP